MVPSIDRGIIGSRIASRAMAERIPLSASVEIIATCNFKCTHCYIAPVAQRGDVMSVADAEILFDRLAAAGVVTLLLTGGEVFTHRHFREIYMAAKRRGFLLQINTNAYLIGERWADFLAEWPPEVLSISLYGLSNERYEEFTGIPNAFGRVVRALDLLQARGLQIALKCPAMTGTVDEIGAMRTFAKARGVEFKYDVAISPEEKGGLRPLAQQLSAERVVQLDQEMDDMGTQLVDAFSELTEKHASNRLYRCGAGKMSLAVNVRGGVSTCVASRQTVGNLLDQPFAEVWEAMGGKISAKLADGHPCATCRFRGVCVGCPATVEAMTGLPDGYVQNYCRITHLRAFTAGAHATGIPRTVMEGIPAHVRVPSAETRRALPVMVLAS